MALNITGDQAADRLLDENAFALLAGMLLDQQIPMEKAFRSPATTWPSGWARSGSTPAAIATADPEAIAGHPSRGRRRCTASPRRSPPSGPRRSAPCPLVEAYDGQAERLWTEAADGPADLLQRLLALPGFGMDKAQIFVALLAKPLRRPARRLAGRCGRVRPDGPPPVGRRRRYSREAFDRVRAWKKEQKAAAKAAALTRLTATPSGARGGPDAHRARGRMSAAALDDTGPCRAQPSQIHLP